MELEKAIKQLKSLQEDRKSFIEDEEEHDSIFMQDFEAIETVLQALEDYKKNLYRVNDENAKLIVLIHDLQQQLENSIPKEVVEKKIEEQEKMIEEMAEYISGFDIDEDVCRQMHKADKYGNCEENCTECVKEHFKKKVRDEE